jgi:hypothetical protein
VIFFLVLIKIVTLDKEIICINPYALCCYSDCSLSGVPRCSLPSVRSSGRDSFSVINELEKTMGQLQLYQWALENQEPERQLFLAISQAVYIRHFQKPIFQLAVQRNRINLLVYEPEREAIVQWSAH